MNICIVDPLKLKGGQEKFILELSNNLNIYFKIHFLSENFNTFSDHKFSESVSVLNFGAFFRLFTLFRAYRYLSNNHIKLLLLNGERSLFFGVFLSIFLPKIKTLYINHLIFETSISKIFFIKRMFYSIFYFLAAENVDYFVSISSSAEFRKNNLKYKGPQFSYIDNAIKKIEFNNILSRTDFNILHNEVLVGFVGRVDIQKDVETLIKAIDYCDDNVKFFIVGDGPQLNYLKSLILPYNINKITFVGYTENPWDYANIFDIVVFPSLYEGLSLSLLEAMSLKLPIIASDIPSFRHCLSSECSCLYFEPSNVRDLANKINKLASNSELRNHIKNNAHNVYQNRFNYNDMTLKYVNLIKSII
ncbi:glycosyltransferase family 4 protein [Polaribacter sp.]|uniref:glycosyltransferase family 4 protein n=1 Tax=Polaribacter sp. TaxID=1920175 RepID=UPI0040486343